VRLTEGLKRSAGLADEALEIFTSHVTMDVEHARIMMEAVGPYAGDAAGQSRVREGAMRSLDARAVMLDGLYKAVFKEPVPVPETPVRVAGD
jgi:pyrroloquinoline-quinone synthase